MKTILFVLLATLPCFTVAQTEINTNDYRLLVGPDLPSKSAFTVSEIFGHDASGYYVIRSKKRGMFGSMAFYKNSGSINEKAKFFIEKYDYQLKLVKSIDLDEILERAGYEYHFIDYQNKKIQLYITQYNYDQKSRALFTQEIDQESLLPIGEPIELHRNNDLKSSNFKGELYASSVSPNERYNFLLIESDIKDKDSRNLVLLSFDQDFNKMWETELNIPFPKKYVDVMSVKIDNFNQAHILVKIKNEVNPQLYQLKIYSIIDEGGVTKEMMLNVPDRHLSNIQTASFNENELVCAGFYSNKQYSSIAGTFYFKLDFVHQQILEEKYSEFEIDFITLFMSDKNAKKMEKKDKKGKDVEMPDYKLDELIIKEDGSILLIAEQFRIDVVTSYYGQYGASTTTYYFNYNDIIVVNYSKAGDVQWMTKVPKAQRTAGDEGFYSSYSMIMQDDNLYFIYNDNLDNFLLDDVKKIRNYVPTSTNSATMISHIDQDGKHKKEVLLYNQQLDAVVKPTISRHLSRNEIILYAHRGSNQNFIAVDLKKRK